MNDPIHPVDGSKDETIKARCLASYREAEKLKPPEPEPTESGVECIVFVHSPSPLEDPMDPPKTALEREWGAGFWWGIIAAVAGGGLGWIVAKVAWWIGGGQ
jgi:hypothetical protein